MRRHFLSFLCCAFAVLPVFSVLRAETPPLLHAAIGNWVAGKEDWALTQRVRTLHDDGRVKEERLERYDPSLPDEQRWHLLEVDGKAPTTAQRQVLERRKNQRPRKHANKPVEDFLDFPNATLSGETARTVTYAITVRPEAVRLAQTEKLTVLVTVGRESRAIERVTVVLRDPMRVALGLAKITGVDFDVSFDPADDDTTTDEANGTVRVKLSKLGEPMEYEWSDFKRVTSYVRPAK